MEFCDQSWNVTTPPPEFVPFCANVKKFSISLESLLFLTFSAKCEQGSGHGKLRNSHGKRLQSLCSGNPGMVRHVCAGVDKAPPPPHTHTHKHTKLLRNVRRPNVSNQLAAITYFLLTPSGIKT